MMHQYETIIRVFEDRTEVGVVWEAEPIVLKAGESLKLTNSLSASAVKSYRVAVEIDPDGSDYADVEVAE
jgi:hypothetical protein